MKENKWLRAAIPALLLHCSIGTVYCWSILCKSIESSIGINCELAFSLAIFFLGISAAVGGPLIERNVKLSSLISTVCFSTGMILSGVACLIKSYPLLLLGYGVIMGIGIGIGYLSPVKTLMMWFSNNKGMATGLAIMGFGVAKILSAPGFSYFIEHFGIVEMFIFHGLFYLIVMLIATAFLKRPPNKEKSNDSDRKLELSKWIEEARNIIKLPKLWTYWLIFYLNITAGLALISNEALFFSLSGLGWFIGYAMSVSAIFNSAGRFGVAWWSDYIKVKSRIFGLILLISVISCTLGYQFTVLIPITIFICNAGYGAMFSIMPNVLASNYGMNNVSKIHGIVLSAWAFAGLTGNQVAKLILDTPGCDQRGVILVTGIIYLIGLLISTRLWNFVDKKQKDPSK
jgi:OFA family oxalate/formate antiporter-like MFS transporter